MIIVCLSRCRLFSHEKQTESLSGKKPPKPKPFFKLIRNLSKFQFFLVIIYITVKKFLNHLILYFKISSIGSILRLIESEMDLVIPKTIWNAWTDDIHFSLTFRLFLEYMIFFYSFYLLIKEEMCRNERWNFPYLVYMVFERSKHHWCRLNKCMFFAMSAAL